MLLNQKIEAPTIANNGATAHVTEAKPKCATPIPLDLPIESNWGRRLSPFDLDSFDRDLLKKHGLSDEVITARRYFRLNGRPEAQRWLRMVGFSKRQSKIGPCLVVPVCDRTGELLEYILLPMEAHYDKKGRLIREVLVKNPLRPRSFNVSPLSFVEDSYDEYDVVAVVWTHSAVNADSVVGEQVVAASLHGKSAKPSRLRRLLVGSEWDVIGLRTGRYHIFVIDSDLDASDAFFTTVNRLATVLYNLGEMVSVVYHPESADRTPTTLASFMAAGHDIWDLWKMMVPWAGKEVPTQ